MTRAALALLASAGAVAAEADLATPLFCTTTEICLGEHACTPAPAGDAFVLRQTGEDWVIQASPRGPEVWAHMAETSAEALATAPEGIRVALIHMGQDDNGRAVLHEHLIESGALNPRFARHLCETEGATS